jgi:hypothetical protein
MCPSSQVQSIFRSSHFIAGSCASRLSDSYSRPCCVEVLDSHEARMVVGCQAVPFSELPAQIAQFLGAIGNRWRQYCIEPNLLRRRMQLPIQQKVTPVIAHINYNRLSRKT